MERAELYFFRARNFVVASLARGGDYAMLHLRGCFFGERQADNLFAGKLLVTIPAGNRMRSVITRVLQRLRSRNHHERTVAMMRSGALLCIQWKSRRGDRGMFKQIGHES